MARGMATAAHCGGELDPWAYRRVVLGSRMAGGRTMTIFTLHAGELWRGRGADKPGWQPKTDSMAGET